MKRKIFYSSLVLAVAAVVVTSYILAFGRDMQPAPAAAAATVHAEPAASYIAGPGRVEPISEEIKVGAALGGKLQAVHVEEGDRVERGHVLALLENGTYRAQVASAEAQLSEAEADLRRIINGARGQERQEALASVEEAEVIVKNARLEMERRQELYGSGDVSREEADRAERELRTAEARLKAATQRHSLVNAVAREEDRSKAEAAVAQARAQLQEASALLEKTFIRSPLTGVVLRKHLKAGEHAAASPDMPIVTVADVRTLRVRVDVDETDIGKLRLGQRVYVTAGAYGEKKFWGRVIRIGQVLGLKNVRTDLPTERVDTKILETLVELDDNHDLYPGLRVDAFIEVSGSELASEGGKESR
jgi:HlyD family secretion protein